MFNDDVYYKPIEVKSAFDGNYVLYESNGDENMLLSIPEYFLKIKPYLYDLIDFYTTIGEWKLQLSMRIVFILPTDATKRQILHSKSDNVEIMCGVDPNVSIEELIDSFMKRFQEGLETKMQGSNYIFERVELLEYHFHKISLKRGSSYIPSPKWISNKKSTINPLNTEDNTCFLFAIVIALNHQNINNKPQRINHLISFIPNYNWDNINFPAGHKDHIAFERDNSDIALNILCVSHNRREIRQSYISKHNTTRYMHANLLMITDGTGNWHYLAIKSIPALLRGITSTQNGDFYCLNCFHSYRHKIRSKNMSNYVVSTIFAI